jgi:hypothetical protein
MNPLSVLRAAKSMGAEFRRVILIGCEPSPENMDPDGPGHMGLSEPVRSVVGEAVRLVEEMVGHLMGSRSQNQSATGGI